MSSTHTALLAALERHFTGTAQFLYESTTDCSHKANGGGGRFRTTVAVANNSICDVEGRSQGVAREPSRDHYLEGAMIWPACVADGSKERSAALVAIGPLG